MEEVYISNILIKKVRHLEDIEICISEIEKKHLIITGKNGSGKTSLLNSIAVFLNSVTNSNDLPKAMEGLKIDEEDLKYCEAKSGMDDEVEKIKARIEKRKDYINSCIGGVMLKLNCSLENVNSVFKKGDFVVAYYQADRVFKAQEPKHIEKIRLKKEYNLYETPREDFIKYLLDLKMTQALAIANGNVDKAEKIKKWFDDFERLLGKIFEDDSARLIFDEETFKFKIHVSGRETFDFNTLSSGYAAILDIVVDLIIRMERQADRTFDFNIQGIVLIDEIETHLHLELQKTVLELLTTIFPNIQFIISTHSPFILNSLDNVTIYDLEKNILINHGLSDVPYSGVVEGYFNVDTLSESLRKKFEEYKLLADKRTLTDEEIESIADLELYLDEIPDYLALDITTEYQRLKNMIRNRKEI